MLYRYIHVKSGLVYYTADKTPEGADRKLKTTLNSTVSSRSPAHKKKTQATLVAHGVIDLEKSFRYKPKEWVREIVLERIPAKKIFRILRELRQAARLNDNALFDIHDNGSEL